MIKEKTDWLEYGEGVGVQSFLRVFNMKVKKSYEKD